jgi:Domain of unknown function (DUF6431)
VAEFFEVTVLFVTVSAPLHKLEADWAEDCDRIILRRCPICKHSLIIGHGHRHKQAHDEHHDWIGIRRGQCADCGKTFTFLPLLSLPYTHYSLLARCQALQLRWEEALPKLKDPGEPPPSTPASSGSCHRACRRFPQRSTQSKPLVTLAAQCANSSPISAPITPRSSAWINCAVSPTSSAGCHVCARKCRHWRQPPASTNSLLYDRSNHLAWTKQRAELVHLIRREDIPRVPQRLPRPLTAEQGSTPAAGVSAPQRSGWQRLSVDSPHWHAYRRMRRSLL